MHPFRDPSPAQPQQAQEPEELAAMPGFGPAPAPRPGPASPDPPPGGSAASASTPTPTPASTDTFFKQRSKAYAEVAKTLLLAVGGWVNRAVAVAEDDESFLPDDDDTDVIPPPLGRAAARRIAFGDGENLSDVQDLLMAAVGLAVWAAKGVSSMLTARRERRRLLQGTAVAPADLNGAGPS